MGQLNHITHLDGLGLSGVVSWIMNLSKILRWIGTLSKTVSYACDRTHMSSNLIIINHLSTSLPMASTRVQGNSSCGYCRGIATCCAYAYDWQNLQAKH